jgi:Ca2+-binding RTX toxin-like protein
MSNPVYILAGQSNAVAMNTEFMSTLQLGSNNTRYFANTVAVGGAPLTWQRGSKDDWMNAQELREDLFTTIERTLLSDPLAIFKGIIWVQGEADTLQIARAELYGHSLLNLVDELRARLEQAFPNRDTQDFELVISSLSQNAPVADERPNWEPVREQQIELAEDHENIRVVDPDIVAHSNNINVDEMFKDDLHYSDAFQEVLMNALVSDLLIESVRRQGDASSWEIITNDSGTKIYYGNDEASTLVASDGDDIIFAGVSDADLRDRIFAGAGNDTIEGGYGNDDIYGQNGDDLIIGGFGSDTLQGQNGNDNIVGSALSDVLFGNAGNDFINGGFGHDQINGGAGADRFYHLGILDHGADFIQDYDAAEGDVLLTGIAGATRNQFQVNTNDVTSMDGEKAGDDTLEEAFIIYRPTGQILWALIDGAAQDQINIRIDEQQFDLLT